MILRWIEEESPDTEVLALGTKQAVLQSGAHFMRYELP